MLSYTAVLNATIPVFLMIGIGMLLRKLNILAPQSDKSFLSLSINCLLPCLTLDALIGNKTLEQIEILLLTPLAGYLSIVLGLGIGLLIAKIVKLKKHSQDNAFAYCMGVYNWGYIPIPLTYALFGGDTVGVLFVFNVGVQMAMWSIALVVLTHGQKSTDNQTPWFKSLTKLLLNPPILALFIGLALNALKADTWIPQAGQELIATLGASSIPLGLLLVGAAFLDVLREASLLQPLRIGILSIITRLLILPCLILLCLHLIPLPLELQRVLAIQAGMPVAVMAILYTKHYQADVHTTAQCVAFTSIVGIVSIPLFMQLALTLIS